MYLYILYRCSICPLGRHIAPAIHVPTSDGQYQRLHAESFVAALLTRGAWGTRTHEFLHNPIRKCHMRLGQVTLEAPSECFSYTLYVHIRHTWRGRPVRLPTLRLPVCSKLLYHVRIGFSVVGPLWYCVRNWRWTITICSHLANCSTQNTSKLNFSSTAV